MPTGEFTSEIPKSNPAVDRTAREIFALIRHPTAESTQSSIFAQRCSLR
jgi:hypothetical protein